MKTESLGSATTKIENFKESERSFIKIKRDEKTDFVITTIVGRFFSFKKHPEVVVRREQPLRVSIHHVVPRVQSNHDGGVARVQRDAHRGPPPPRSWSRDQAHLRKDWDDEDVDKESTGVTGAPPRCRRLRRRLLPFFLALRPRDAIIQS